MVVFTWGSHTLAFFKRGISPDFLSRPEGRRVRQANRANRSSRNKLQAPQSKGSTPQQIMRRGKHALQMCCSYQIVIIDLCREQYLIRLFCFKGTAWYVCLGTFPGWCLCQRPPHISPRSHLVLSHSILSQVHSTQSRPLVMFWLVEILNLPTYSALQHFSNTPKCGAQNGAGVGVTNVNHD